MPRTHFVAFAVRMGVYAGRHFINLQIS
jgi:hypothetical protein